MINVSVSFLMVRRGIACVAALLLMASANHAFAEGGCPPGHYPIGDSRAPGCAPIPTTGEAGGEPRPTGRWIKTWGAIAMAASNGDLGVALGQPSKGDAVKDSLAKCAQYGAVDCKVHLTIKNQCLAVASSIGTSQAMFGSGGSKDRASVVALNACESKAGGKCKVSYAECTEPVFQPF